MKNPSTKRNKGEAELMFALFLIAFAWTALVFVLTQDITRSECTHYGKTKVFGVLYECKKIEEKK